MNSGRHANPATVVEAALAALPGIVATAQGPNVWRVTRASGVARLRLEEPWLQCSGHFDRGRVHGPAVPARAWELLERNAAVGRAARLVLPPGGAGVHAAAEMLLEESLLADPALLVPKLHESLNDLAAVTESAELPPADRDPASPAPDDEGPTDLDGLCGEAGWTAQRRGDGTLAVPLEAARCVAVAELLREGGAWRAWTPVTARKQEPGESQRPAVGVLLLKLGGALRTVRPAVRPAVRRHEPRGSAGLEVFLGKRPSARLLAEALSALSVAAAMAVREVAVLTEDPTFSDRFLAFLAQCGCSAPAPGQGGGH